MKLKGSACSQMGVNLSGCYGYPVPLVGIRPQPLVVGTLTKAHLFEPKIHMFDPCPVVSRWAALGDHVPAMYRLTTHQVFVITSNFSCCIVYSVLQPDTWSTYVAITFIDWNLLALCKHLVNLTCMFAGQRTVTTCCRHL